ncbi:MAG: hypothetical protein JO363_08420, partial [Solirubrobacterales bacterium]|nr:hypothetical protein [Solirubrobacterales bacterium]
MRKPRLTAVITAVATAAALAAGSAGASAAVLQGGPGVAHASAAGHCLSSGVCINVTTLGAKHFIDVTGTPGNDNIQFKTITAFGNNSLPHLGVNGFDTGIDEFDDTFITVNGVAGNDTISLAGLNTVPFTRFGVNPKVYTKATLRSGRGNSTLIAANSASDTNVLIAGPGQNVLLARNGRVDTVEGAGHDTAQVDKT